MSNDTDRLIQDDDSEFVGGAGAQTSNKEGLASSSRKPTNTGPDPHEEHKAPVSGAFGNPETRDREPAAKGRKRDL
jgi:hypothetical protein